MLKRFSKQRRSVAALEFAIVAPLLVVLLFGVYDLSSALITYEEVYSAAHSIAASISGEAVQASGTNALTYTQIQQAESILWAEIPALRSGMQDGVKSVTVSSIVFEPVNVLTSSGTAYTSYKNTTNPSCTTGASASPCDYAPVVVWSVAYAGGDSTRTFDTPTTANNAYSSGSWTTTPYSPSGTADSGTSTSGATLRSCSYAATSIPSAITTPSTIKGTLNQTSGSGGTPGDLSNLRTYGLTWPDDASPAPPSPIIVVDVQLNYNPVIGLVVGKSFPIWVSAYWPVRSAQVSTTTVYPLTEEFTTLTPSVPTGTTATHLSDYTTGNVNVVIYDADGNLVPNGNGVAQSYYCVNTTLFNTYGSPPETQ